MDSILLRGIRHRRPLANQIAVPSSLTYSPRSEKLAAEGLFDETEVIDATAIAP
jgi:hypothetical protein